MGVSGPLDPHEVSRPGDGAFWLGGGGALSIPLSFGFPQFPVDAARGLNYRGDPQYAYKEGGKKAGMERIRKIPAFALKEGLAGLTPLYGLSNRFVPQSGREGGPFGWRPLGWDYGYAPNLWVDEWLRRAARIPPRKGKYAVEPSEGTSLLPIPIPSSARNRLRGR